MKNETQSERELLPCPFCGGKAEVAYIDNDEACLTGFYPRCTECSINDDCLFSETESAISSWNTRTQTPPAMGNAVRELVNQQAEDDGLWFISRTITEAYLQQALRKLHAVIEQTPPASAVMDDVLKEAKLWAMPNDNEPTHNIIVPSSLWNRMTDAFSAATAKPATECEHIPTPLQIEHEKLKSELKAEQKRCDIYHDNLQALEKKYAELLAAKSAVGGDDLLAAAKFAVVAIKNGNYLAHARERLMQGIDWYEDAAITKATASGTAVEGELEELRRFKTNTEAMMCLIGEEVAFMGANWSDEVATKGYVKECYLGSIGCLLMNDTFYYASADAEPVGYDEWPAVKKIYEDHGNEGLIAWAALRRGHEPLPPLLTDKYLAAKEALTKATAKPEVV